MSRHGSLDCKVYIGDLARDVNEKDIEKAFNYYGPLRSVWVARNPPGFAFVEYEDDRDADDAIKGLDGSSLGGNRIRVERSTGKIRPKPWARRGGGAGGGGGRGGDGGMGGPRGGRRNFDSNDKSRSRDRSYRRRSSSRSRSRSRSRD